MVATDEQKTDTSASDNGTEKKARKRINPKVKMAKALYTMLGENLRENDFTEARDTARDLARYLDESLDD